MCSKIYSFGYVIIILLVLTLTLFTTSPIGFLEYIDLWNCLTSLRGPSYDNSINRRIGAVCLGICCFAY
jgi:phage shock protein PspC (stress-responsive transcriptional regulator)